MKIRFFPSRANGRTASPPSKSMAHRLLIAAALAQGESVIHGVSSSEDVCATLDAISALGARWVQTGGTVVVHGTDPTRQAEERRIRCRECGSTLRFMIPLCLLGGGRCVLEGSERLLSRPLTVYEKIAEEQALLFERAAHTLTLGGRLTPGVYRVAGDVSSQFITGLMFALPLLAKESRIVVLPPFESRPYVEMTVDVLRTFGIAVERTDEHTFFIPGSQTYRPQTATVEGDHSNAAFLDALNYTSGCVEVTGLNELSLQGDRIYREHFRAIVHGCPQIDLSDCPDLGPILMVLAALHHGGEFRGIRRLRIKESDRAYAMATELEKCAVSVTIEGDRLIVPKQTPVRAREALFGHNDHRIVMALSVLLSAVGGTLDGTEAVNKSFPDFFDRLKALGIRFEDASL